MEEIVREPVYLNIYDMYWTNQYTSSLGVGVFHTGVELYGIECAYGGHPFEFSGIFEITPKDSEELGEHYKYRESVILGYTSFTRDEVRQAVAHLGRDFKGSSYHLMNKNCNHFSSTLCQLLCGKELPNWVNRLAYVSTCIPFLEKCIPKEWLTPQALEESVRMTNAAGGIGIGSATGSGTNSTTAMSPGAASKDGSGSPSSSSRGSTAALIVGNGFSSFLDMFKSKPPATGIPPTGESQCSSNGFVDLLASCNGAMGLRTGSQSSCEEAEEYEYSPVPPSQSVQGRSSSISGEPPSCRQLAVSTSPTDSNSKKGLLQRSLSGTKNNS